MGCLIEDLADKMTAFQASFAKLCAKSGHDFKGSVDSWFWCALHSVGNDRESPHRTKCQICGVFACEVTP